MARSNERDAPGRQHSGGRGGAETLTAGRTPVDVTKPDKVLFPDDGITKADLAHYYQRIATTMVRHARNRPLAAERFPEGIRGQRIFQKNVPEHYPDWIRRVDVPKKEGGTTEHAVCDDAATLVYLADQACVTPHVWLSRVDDLERPDRLIFDLDPSGQQLDRLRSAARRVRELFEQLGLQAFVMTTGSRGFHVAAPLRREHAFDEVRDFARRAASALAGSAPEELTVQQRKEDRGDRIFLDYLRNAYGQTAVAPYSVRAKPGAPVAMPLAWEELDDTVPWQYTLDGAVRRVRERGDAWSNFASRARSLARPLRRLDEFAAD